MCGGGGGGGVPGPTSGEQEQISLQNQLLQQQIADQAKLKAEEARKLTPEYLNQELLNNRGTKRKEYNTAIDSEYKEITDPIIQRLTDAGMQDRIPGYLAQVRADLGGYGYREGTPYSYGDEVTTSEAGKVTRENFNEEAYLQANPDVAEGIARGEFQNGAQHFLMRGINEGRLQLIPKTNRPVVQGTQDSYDDPTSLSNKDYLGSVIDDMRSGRKQASYKDAQQVTSDRIRGMGLDWDYGSNLIKQAHDRLANTYQTSGLGANDYSQVFDPNALLDSVLGNERTAKRGQYSVAARTAFGGIDPNTDFADTADDPFISDIVGTQYNDAKGALDRAKARGALTDVGYNSGLTQLGQSKSAADNTAQTLGGAILTRNRNTLSGIKGNAETKAGAWDFGQSFDPNTFLNEYTSKKGALASGLGGEINTALQGQNFFDIGSILTKAGYAQGAQNTPALTEGFTTPAGAAIAAERDKLNKAGRGLGGTGVF